MSDLAPPAIRPRTSRPPVPGIVVQHVEEAAHLRRLRSRLVGARHERLASLARLDERIAAHLDGIAVAGSWGAESAQRSLERAGLGEVFVATVRALEDRDPRRLQDVLAIAEAIPELRAGCISAFGWVGAASLRGITVRLVASAHPWNRELALAACAMHGVDPGVFLESAIRDEDAGVRARACSTAAICGRRDLIDACVAAASDADPLCAVEAARAAVLLGDRGEGLATLESLVAGGDPSSLQRRAGWRTALLALPLGRARNLLASLRDHHGPGRTLVEGIALVGDPQLVPWLIDRMQEPALARPAGAAFAFVTGLDLVEAGLIVQRPGTKSAAADESHPEAVEDDALAWPDVGNVDRWWHLQGGRFPPGKRCFAGSVLSAASCAAVLAGGFQYQRAVAAEHGTLLAPGTPLFDTRAPAWRQRRALGDAATP